MTTTQRDVAVEKKACAHFLKKSPRFVLVATSNPPSRCQLLYLDAERKGALHLRLARGNPGGLLHQPGGDGKNGENSTGDMISKWLD